jgi:hypothetical protein
MAAGSCCGLAALRATGRLRWAQVEIAMHAMKRSDATGRWARRLAIRKGVKTARVALARRLCDDIVQVWRDVEQ